MSTNIRRELTSTITVALKDSTLKDAIATSLNIQSPRKLVEVTEKVFSALLLYAIDKDDFRGVKKMLNMGADVNAQDSDGKTSLHEAVMLGNLKIIEYLLMNGASVHLKTQCGESPLLIAVKRDEIPIIKLLLQCGAHLTTADLKAANSLISIAARTGDVMKLESLRLAGADLNSSDELQQTALHQAVLCNHDFVVNYLIQNEVAREATDRLGRTPLDYAQKLGYTDIVDSLNRVSK